VVMKRKQCLVKVSVMKELKKTLSMVEIGRNGIVIVKSVEKSRRSTKQIQVKSSKFSLSLLMDQDHLEGVEEAGGGTLC
jgi:hypothetical protein